MLSGFAGKVRAGALSSTDYGTLRKGFFADIRRKTLRPLWVFRHPLQARGHLIGKQAMTRQFRTLDAIPLAVALRFHRSFPLDAFVCADQRLSDVSRPEGLTVIQP
ncbi:MAG: hypothetical protein KatS3mg108_2583 [Isosphaeraceae bacterium]|jgi:hypothetical protein|nr:MAG: hypothetical protein KatS3mg108_2583 [Isosphaeraceae bacterium]